VRGRRATPRTGCGRAAGELASITFNSEAGNGPQDLPEKVDNCANVIGIPCAAPALEDRPRLDQPARGPPPATNVNATARIDLHGSAGQMDVLAALLALRAGVASYSSGGAPFRWGLTRARGARGFEGDPARANPSASGHEHQRVPPLGESCRPRSEGSCGVSNGPA
jgi:hypothetical protein